MLCQAEKVTERSSFGTMSSIEISAPESHIERTRIYTTDSCQSSIDREKETYESIVILADRNNSPVM